MHLGLARADHPAGPWTRVVEQPLEVDPGEDMTINMTILTLFMTLWQEILETRSCWVMAV